MMIQVDLMETYFYVDYVEMLRHTREFNFSNVCDNVCNSNFFKNKKSLGEDIVLEPNMYYVLIGNSTGYTDSAGVLLWSSQYTEFGLQIFPFIGAGEVRFSVYNPHPVRFTINRTNFASIALTDAD